MSKVIDRNDIEMLVRRHLQDLGMDSEAIPKKEDEYDRQRDKKVS